MKLNKKANIIAILLVVIGIIECIVLEAQKSSYERFMLAVAYSSIINLSVTLIGIIRAGYNWYGLASIFIALSYVFNFGQVYCYVFFTDFTSHFINAISDNFELTRKSLTMALIVILIISISIIYEKNNKKIFLESMKVRDLPKDRLRIMGWLMLFVTMPFEIYYYYQLFKSATTTSYFDALSIEIGSYIVQLGSFTIVALVILLCAYEENITKANLIFWFGIMFYACSMLTGSRIYGIVSICVLVYFYIQLVNKISPTKFFLFIVSGMVLLVFMNSIMHVRQYGALTFQAIIEYALNKENNFLASSLYEFGGTLYTLKITLWEVPNQLDYHYGLSYIKSIAYMFPNVGGLVSSLTDSIEFTRVFNTRYSYGGNYIAELYYNFGNGCYLMAFVVGVVIGNISKAMDYYAKKKNFLKSSMLVMFMYSFLIWIRSYANILTRNIIWAWGLIYLCYLFACKVKQYKK